MKKIFLIDQEKLRSSLVTLSLKNRGITTYCTDSPQDCYHLIEDMRPDVLLVDIKTITTSQNLLFFTKVKENPMLAKIPIIGIGTDDEFKKINKSKILIKGLIRNPISPTNLLQEIRKEINSLKS